GDLVLGREARVVLAREAGREGRGPAGSAAADDDRHTRTVRAGRVALDGLGQGGRVGELVVLAVVVEGLPDRRAPQAREDLELLGERAEALRGERDAVRGVLGLEPARTEPELDAPAGHLVDLRDLDSEHPRVAEGHRGHERAEADAARLAREGTEGDPR